MTPCVSAVQGSTELWEWDSQLASEAFKLHDRVLRQYMTQVSRFCWRCWRGQEGVGGWGLCCRLGKAGGGLVMAIQGELGTMNSLAGLVER